MSPKKSEYIEILREEGPKTGDEVPFGNLSVGARIRNDVRRFDLNGKVRGTTSRFPQTLVVYYLHGDHSKVRVLGKWFDVNRERIENHGRPVYYESVTRALPSEFCDAWGVVRGDIDWLDTMDRSKSGYDGSREQECPYCGSTDIATIPNHLRDGCPDAA